MRELKLAIPTAENTSRGKKIHGRVSNPLLNKLHVEDRLAISNQRAIHRKVEAPNQAAELPRIRTKLLASNGHIRLGAAIRIPDVPVRSEQLRANARQACSSQQPTLC